MVLALNAYLKAGKLPDFSKIAPEPLWQRYAQTFAVLGIASVCRDFKTVDWKPFLDRLPFDPAKSYCAYFKHEWRQNRQFSASQQTFDAYRGWFLPEADWAELSDLRTFACRFLENGRPLEQLARMHEGTTAHAMLKALTILSKGGAPA